MKVDAKEMLKRLKGPDDRKATSIYVSEKLYKEFTKACGDVPVSRILEELMQAFLDSSKAK